MPLKPCPAGDNACELAAAVPPQSWQALNVNQRAELISFSYNCGPYWYGSGGYTTLNRQQRNHEWVGQGAGGPDAPREPRQANGVPD